VPYVSDKQRRWAHTASAKKAGFPTKEWDNESRGISAEEYGKQVAHKKKKARKHKAPRP
jgi:hypothetical protein